MNEAIAELFAGIVAVLHVLVLSWIFYLQVPPEWIHGFWTVLSIKIVMGITYVGIAGTITTLVDIANNVRKIRTHMDIKAKVERDSVFDKLGK